MTETDTRPYCSEDGCYRREPCGAYCRDRGNFKSDKKNNILNSMCEAVDVAAGRPHNARVTFSTNAEFFLDGIRFAPGRYSIKREDDAEEGQDAPSHFDHEF